MLVGCSLCPHWSILHLSPIRPSCFFHLRMAYVEFTRNLQEFTIKSNIGRSFVLARNGHAGLEGESDRPT